MITLLLVIGILCVFAYRAYKSIDNYSYGVSLEHYILSNYPRTTGDVDRLTAEYNYKVSRGEIWTQSKNSF